MGGGQKDKWDKSDIIFKSIGAILIPVAIVALGFFGDRFLQRRQESEERIRLYSELMSQREESESDLRKDMFTSIIESFLDKKETSLEDEVLNLELLAYNFHESLNLKPLFVHLARKINTNSDISHIQKMNFLSRLEKMSRDIIAKQMYILEEVGYTVDMTVNLKNFEDKANKQIQVQTYEIELQGIKRKVEIEALDADTKEKRILIGLWITTFPTQTLYYVQASWIGLFDFPTINTIRLSHDQRCSLALKNFDQTSAEITLIYFPGSYASLKEKPYYEEVVRKLKSK
jgi:hypothetical protein